MAEIAPGPGMSGQRWEVERVAALAPDPASLAAGRKLAGSGGWAESGCDDAAVWGAVRGSGASPYYVAVDLDGPAYKCSCPSRKIPCKHVLGLLLRWAGGEVVAGGAAPDQVVEWLAGRAARAERAVKKAAAPAKPPDPVAQAKRAELRADRVTVGLVELDRWLGDQLRGGLAQLQRNGYPAIDGVAARMVDAQAPGIASWLRGLPLLAGRANWPALLEELALIRLLVRAHERLADFDRDDPAFAATVRGQVGYPVSKEAVLAGPGISDVWSVARVRDTELETLRQRTVYLSGQNGRMAVVLSFAAAGQGLDESLLPGISFSGTLHFYPGSWPTRALVGSYGDAQPAAAPPAGSVARAVERVAAAVAADPWVRSVPVWVLGRPTPSGSDWLLADASGEALPVNWGQAQWSALAVSGGAAMPILLEWGPRGWLPLACFAPEGMLVPL